MVRSTCGSLLIYRRSISRDYCVTSVLTKARPFMRSLVVILALSATLVGSQTSGVAERSEPEDKGYLHDSGSRKAAETAGQPPDMEPGQQASSDILVSRDFPGPETHSPREKRILSLSIPGRSGFLWSKAPRWPSMQTTPVIPK